MDQKRFLGLMDMIDGGGMGRSGKTFEGGPLSGFFNALDIRPAGYMQRMQAEAMPRYMAGPAPATRPEYRPMAGPAPAPNPYAPGAIETTVLPPMGQMSDEALMRIILDAMERSQDGGRR